MNDVKISVILPAFNEEKYIKESVYSILNQTFDKFELIIVDDGSVDKTVEIVESIKDKRIKLIKLSENKGNHYASNVGIVNARGKYLVRQDADDISFPYRLEKQYDFMERNPEIGFSGGQIELFGKKTGYWNFPIGKEEVKAYFIFGISVSQPTSIIRSSVLKANNIFYDTSHSIFAEDYNFFFKLNTVSDGANIPDTLIKYRIHDSNTSSIINNKKKIILKQNMEIVLNYYNIFPTDKQLESHFLLSAFKAEKYDSIRLKRVYQWKKKLTGSFKKSQALDISTLNQLLKNKWNKIFYFCVDSGGLKSALTYLFLSRMSLKQLKYLASTLFNNKNSI